MTIEQPKTISLWEIAQVFLKLGSTAFGGPVAHLAILRTEVVKKRKWITEEEFLDFISAANFIPGPNSTEVAIHVGYRMAGGLGLVVAGVCFILPAALIVAAIAWAYVTYGHLPKVQTVFYGIKPMIIAIVFHALWSFGRSALKNKILCVLCGLAFFALFLGVNEILILVLAGSSAMLASDLHRRDGLFRLGFTISNKSLLASGAGVSIAVASVPVTMTKLFLFFLKVGSVLFGSGYVLIGFLRTDLVERWHWLTESQLLDAVAVGQLTPGPVFTTATFIGYLLAGSKGAVIATVGIFLPAFIFVSLSAPLMPRLRRSQRARKFLDGLNVASLAVMGFAGILLAKAAIVDLPTIALAFFGTVVLFKTRANSIWLVLFGGFIGYLLNV